MKHILLFKDLDNNQIKAYTTLSKLCNRHKLKAQTVRNYMLRHSKDKPDYYANGLIEIYKLPVNQRA